MVKYESCNVVGVISKPVPLYCTKACPPVERGMQPFMRNIWPVVFVSMKAFQMVLPLIDGAR